MSETDLGFDKDDEEKDDERFLLPLKRAAALVLEHFDTVQVFATKMTKGGTHCRSAQWGGGNWYARYGQAREWVKSMENDMTMGHGDET